MAGGGFAVGIGVDGLSKNILVDVTRERTPVDDQRRAGDAAGLVRGQVECGVGDFFGLEEAL